MYQVHPVGSVFTHADFGRSDELTFWKIDIQIKRLVDLVLDVILQIPDLKTSVGLTVFPDKF
ncbi:hypothetical protein ES703_75320 [subsurface metagenome]